MQKLCDVGRGISLPTPSPARSLHSLAGHPLLEEDMYSVNNFYFPTNFGTDNIPTNSPRICTRSLTLTPKMPKLCSVGGRIPSCHTGAVLGGGLGGSSPPPQKKMLKPPKKLLKPPKNFCRYRCNFNSIWLLQCLCISFKFSLFLFSSRYLQNDII